jgi:aspartyl-tRNA(Asn)/glutamyl-tRNA(Gln) amidotransferase subunit A
MKPWRLTAGELAAGYTSRELDPVEVLNACMERLEDVNPTLNAVVASDRNSAMQAAGKSAERWKAGIPLSALDGVPVTVKDNLFVKGMRATWGSAAYESFVPEEDDLPVARLRASGAVILGKTNTPEFALAGHTNNLIFGSTGNPWAPDLSPGGSSGGAASALMAGVAPLALGTDAGGSTRRPASHCGCIGLRTSIGAIPRRHGFPPLAGDFQTVGLLTRSVADIRRTLDCVGAPSPQMSGLPAKMKMKVAAVCEIGDHPVDPEIRAAFGSFTDAVRALGSTVIDVDPPFDPDEATALFMDIAAPGVARVVDSLGSAGDGLTEAIRSMAEEGRRKPAADYVKAMDAVMAFRWTFADFFEQWDFLILPTAAALPWPRTDAGPRIIDGQAAGPRASAIYTTFVNVAGLPGISVPFAESADGLPIGMQIVGPAGSDRALIDIAEQLELDVHRPQLVL